MKNKYILFYLAISALFSCNNYSPDIVSDYQYKDSLYLESTDKIQFEIDEYTGLINQSLQFYSDPIEDSSYLVLLNENNNGLYFYNMLTKHKKLVRFPKEGPSGVGNLNGFLVHNLDSIFLLNSSKYEVTLVKGLFKSNRTMQSFSLLMDSIGINSAKPLGTTGNRLIYKGNKIYSIGFPDLNPISEKFFESAKNVHILNLKDSTIDSKSIYTEHYKNNLWSLHFLHTYSDFNERNELVFSLPASHEIVIVDTDFNKTKVYAGSKFVNSIEPMKDKNYEYLATQMHYYSNPSYYMILYDKYRNVYYRFIELVNKKAIENNDERMVSKIPSIIILDDNFKKVGEVLLPPYEYIPIMSFVGIEGLYISKPVLTPSRLGVEEDLLGFDLFKLKKK